MINKDDRIDSSLGSSYSPVPPSTPSPSSSSSTDSTNSTFIYPADPTVNPVVVDDLRSSSTAAQNFIHPRLNHLPCQDSSSEPTGTAETLKVASFTSAAPLPLTPSAQPSFSHSDPLLQSRCFPSGLSPSPSHPTSSAPLTSDASLDQNPGLNCDNPDSPHQHHHYHHHHHHHHSKLILLSLPPKSSSPLILLPLETCSPSSQSSSFSTSSSHPSPPLLTPPPYLPIRAPSLEQEINQCRSKQLAHNNSNLLHLKHSYTCNSLYNRATNLTSNFFLQNRQNTFIRRRAPTVGFGSTVDKHSESLIKDNMYSSLPLDSKDEPSSPSEISSNANTSSESISLPSTPFLFRQPIAQSSTATSAEQQSRRRSWLDYALIILLLVVLGTVTVLSTARSYFGIYPNDVILSSELSVSDVPSRIPKIIHQTWKSSQIPKKWVAVRESCAALHEDWDYKLWTDESGRELIAQEYPWFLDTYDGYPFPIQRADAVRYFILHHYGGVYMDLDIGCLRPMDSLLRFDMVLPQTVPVGISNDLMFSAKRHPFLEFVIHRLANFDHNYHFNYATVMFSTGPMALSALLSQFRNSLPLGPSPLTSFGPVRILPPKMYGKNLPSPQPHPGPFFTHYYGSSWHTDGAGLVLWLGKFGIFFLYGAAAIVLACGARAIMSKLFGCGSSGEQNQHISRSWSQGFASKNRSSGGALWKRRIRRARKAEGKLTDAILLPAHWLERAALSSTSKKFPMKRSHSAKSHEGCKSCKPEANSPYFLDTELPPYESGSSVSYLQLPLSAAGSGKFSYNSGYNTDTEKSYEGENCSGPSSYPSKKFITTPTPIPVPTTPTFYRSTSSSNSLGSTPSVSASRTDASGLSSPLQKAIQRLADLAGIVGDSSSSENFQLHSIHGEIDQEHNNSQYQRPSNSWNGGQLKVD